MSHYISFRFAGKLICSFPSVSNIYSFFYERNAPTDTWEPISYSCLSLVEDDIKEEICAKNRLIEINERMMNANSIAYKNLFEAASSISEYTEDLKELERSLHYVEFLLLILSESDKDLEWWLQ